MEVKYHGIGYIIQNPHPAANCLPWSTDCQDFTDLIESVKAGFDDDKPIVVQKGTDRIISGRRRALACAIARVKPVTREVDWDDARVIDFVRRDELIRRNLTESQRAASLVSLNELKENGTNQYENKAKEGPSADGPSKSTREISRESGASTASVERLSALKKSSPELLELIKEKKLPINTALRVAKELTPAQRKQVIDADDPKAKAKALLPVAEKKPKPKTKPAAKTAETPEPSEPLDPCRGGNNFDFGANAPKDAEPGHDVEPVAETPAERAAAFNKELESTCREIDKLKARIEEWKPNPLCYSTHWQSHVAQLESVRKSIWQGRPVHECPYCDGIGVENGEPCKPCKGTGYLKRHSYDSACAALGIEVGK